MPGGFTGWLSSCPGGMAARSEVLLKGSPKVDGIPVDSIGIELLCLWVCPVWEWVVRLNPVLSDERRGKSGKHADSHSWFGWYEHACFVNIKV